MNRNVYTSQYTVPSLSLASSRSRKNMPIPTKDTSNNQQKLYKDLKPRQQIFDRINKPSILNSKVYKNQKIQMDNVGNYNRNQSGSKIYNSNSTLCRNVYLLREQQRDINLIMQQPSPEVISQQPQQPLQMARGPQTSSLLKNIESNKVVSQQIQRKLQQRKLDTNKTLFEHRIKKLLQEIQFYDKQLMEMHEDDYAIINKKIVDLELCRKQSKTLLI